jgi:hypothetical protein
MKSISAFAFAAALLCQSALSASRSASSLRGAGIVPDASSSSKSGALPPVGGRGRKLDEPDASSSSKSGALPPAGGRGRILQRPDETCYKMVKDSDDTTVPQETACTSGFLGACNNVPACAGSTTDAINLGSLWCTGFTVWNNEESYCPWQYMCCNQ